MAVLDDLVLPSRLLAGGGPSTPDPRVLAALTTPVIGQFDPAFTAIMDEVMSLGRHVFLTSNARCYPISGLAAAGLESLLNTLLAPDDGVAVAGGSSFVREVASMARRVGAHVMPYGQLGPRTRFLIAPLMDPTLGTRLPIGDMATACHAQGVSLIVEGTHGLAACELRVDDWHVDACVAGVDHAVGAPSGMALVTYTAEVESMMHARTSPPRTSYLDLIQLQAYWSAERLNHHTAPTSLVYGLREALRLVHAESLTARWDRHLSVGHALHAGLQGLGLSLRGEPPYAIVDVPHHIDERLVRQQLLEDFGIHIRLVAEHTWRLGLLGADAQMPAVRRVLAAFEHVLRQHRALHTGASGAP